jgi:hypothetical protein
LLGAHFLRAANLVAAILCAAAPLMLLWNRRWIPIVLQVLAYGAAGIWVVTALHLVNQRILEGRDWTLSAVILGAVVLLTVLAGLLLNSGVSRNRYLH